MFELRSSSFDDGEPIPNRHGKQTENVPVPLSWSDPPDGTRSFALSMLDRISPGNTYVHWLVADIPVDANSLGSSGDADGVPPGSRQLKPYVGPFPPSGTHRYEFTLYALGTDRLDLQPGVALEGFEQAAERQALGRAQLTGTFAARRS